MDGFRFRKLESDGDDQRASAHREADVGYGSSVDDASVIIHDSDDVNAAAAVRHPFPHPEQNGTYLSVCKCRFVISLLSP